MKIRALAAIAALFALTACNMDSSPATENPTTGLSSSGTKIVPASQAIRQADLTGTDLGTMTDADVAKVMRPGPHCSFSYVSGGKPVLIAVPDGASGSRGYIKLHGMLVELATGEPDIRAFSDGPTFGPNRSPLPWHPCQDARTHPQGKPIWCSPFSRDYASVTAASTAAPKAGCREASR